MENSEIKPTQEEIYQTDQELYEFVVMSQPQGEGVGSLTKNNVVGSMVVGGGDNKVGGSGRGNVGSEG